MDPELTRLKVLLMEGLRLSGQGSYQRRLPSKAALPVIREAREGLRALSRTEPGGDVFRALSLAEEALLHYPQALSALEAAIALSAPDKRDLKRLANLRECAARWAALGLSPAALAALGAFLEARLEVEPCDHTLRHTESWLTSSGAGSKAAILKALRSAGGFCDCEVVLNVV